MDTKHSEWNKYKEPIMAKSTLGMIEQFGHEVEVVAGDTVRQQVMTGAESLTPKTKPGAIALWVRDAIERLDTLAAEGAPMKVMEHCGTNCAHVNRTPIERGKARRAGHATEEAFLAAEIRKPQTSTRLEHDGDILYQIYTPAAFSRPMRCYCGLLRGLPEGVQVSPTYCHCSGAFVRTYWSEVLGRPVEVDILETAISGSTECRFKIAL
jgi:hypothetical protein